MIPTLLLGVAMAAHLEVYARGLDDAGALLALDDGTVLVSRPALNDVLSLRDVDGDGRVDAMRTALSFIDHAHGLAIHDDTLYVAGVKELVSAQRQPDGSFAETRVLVEDLPDGGPHPERALAIGPDDKLYVAIAGTCASCTESNPEHGTLLQFDRDGANRRIFARGLRDRTAFAWHPKTHELWGAERAKLLRIGEGFDDRAGSATAALSLPRRLVPSAFAFEKNGDAFAAIGARVVRIHFAEGKPASIEDYATIEGRIGGLALARDGALLVSDAEHGIVYRVTRNHPPMTSSASEINAQPILAKAFAVRGLRHPQSVI
ncbi:MAG TPA: hypothetical protein VJZ00_07465, partial [Thermoanaerobaculia bacterium]|nr:hypothetical protein [Thermoanaerobaculia bacterium]